MKIRFYEIDRERMGRGKLAGEAEYANGMTTIKTEDDKLRKLLTTPYTTLGKSTVTENTISDGYVTYQPNTQQFLEILYMESWRFGYLAERE